jgi:hypothetical protein
MIIGTRTGDVVERMRLDGEAELFEHGGDPLAGCPHRVRAG